ncbi:sensor histidine kinase [Streptomyces sp. ID05-04B]|uniref:sensor histidine kinase n=1 Tax=Streptomyces sp. ID05-04B TaxID=3028661 RepID=UPI0029C54265|nr:sensor histidine kinase [Streptomyces sp. ID05-04B]MDX5562682.1 sensor histidine kinase [Streptomyces sp. ID05-04B]
MTSALSDPSPAVHQSTPDAPRPHRATFAALVAVAAGLDLGDLYWFGFTTYWPAVIAVAGAALGISMAWRRTRPVAALVVAGLGYLVAWVAVVSFPNAGLLPTMAQAAVWVVVFSHVAEGTSQMRQAAIAVLGVCIALEGLQNIQMIDRNDAPTAMVLYDAMTFSFVPLVLCAAADAVRGRIQLATAQAAQAERLRELDARAAAHDERLRLARELHDVVANRLSAVTMRITAAGHVRRLPASDESRVLDEIGTEIDTALGELRSMLGTLRSDQGHPDTAAPPSLENIGELAGLARRTGANVRVVVHGTPVPLPSMLDLTAYRILQEALANVSRHARPPHATAMIDYRPGSVCLRVDDEGTCPVPAAPPGHGIIGMRERAALCGGWVSAGARPGGGWTVEATLPLPERTT